MEYVDIEKDLIPYCFDISLEDEIFTFEVHYNEQFDYFTVDLEKDGEVLTTGEKLVYGMTLFYDVIDNRFPRVPIVPYDQSETESIVNWRTLSESVFLYLIKTEGEDDE
ncbi:phage baseplate plug family protein [Paenibacillus sp. USHLN196]|uniref:phage baseplate plug family protein n=1 Tax=Paenibacillus sp. USHLN196 TaxID=3081291 RepID=UPI003019CFC8